MTNDSNECARRFAILLNDRPPILDLRFLTLQELDSFFN